MPSIAFGQCLGTLVVDMRSAYTVYSLYDNLDNDVCQLGLNNVANVAS